MFDPKSRYYKLETLTITNTDGTQVAYKERRFLPHGRDLPLLMEVPVKAGDRLDLVAARTLSQPEFFWKICDGNDAMNPLELTERASGTLRVPIPKPQ